jgi:hypothetical protein
MALRSGIYHTDNDVVRMSGHSNVSAFRSLAISYYAPGNESEYVQTIIVDPWIRVFGNVLAKIVTIDIHESTVMY